MFYYLRVWDEFKALDLGILEINHAVWPTGEVSKGWEWRGASGLSDGGNWEWVDSGSVRLALTSNLTKRVVAELTSPKWSSGPVPPHQPWFTRQGNVIVSKNRLFYFGPNIGQQKELAWDPK
jgi:hypothetical protein